MLDKIIKIDQDVFLYFNQFNSSFFDNVMYWVSHPLFWIPLYLFFFYLLFKKFGLKPMLVMVILIGVTFALTDLISVELFKKVFERLRPSHEPKLEGLVHLVDNYRGGQFGFVSSHAASVFGLATVMTLLLFKEIKRFWIFVFLWAILVSYSRLYLGVHYPLDLICGGILGMSIGLLMFTIFKRFNILGSKFN